MHKGGLKECKQQWILAFSIARASQPKHPMGFSRKAEKPSASFSMSKVSGAKAAASVGAAAEGPAGPLQEAPAAMKEGLGGKPQQQAEPLS